MFFSIRFLVKNRLSNLRNLGVPIKSLRGHIIPKNNQRRIFSDNSILNEEVNKHKKLPRKIEIDPLDLSWKYVRGSGKGGQKTNKTSNCVQLTHIPTSIMIKCHSSRELETNKNYAIKRLKQRLDEFYNGDQSKTAIEQQKKSSQKARRKRKSLKKYGSKNSKEDDE